MDVAGDTHIFRNRLYNVSGDILALENLELILAKGELEVDVRYLCCQQEDKWRLIYFPQKIEDNIIKGGE